jgi:hypothetical protein
MPSFSKGNLNGGAPFGNNQYLRSTQDVKVESGLVSSFSVNTEVVFGSLRAQKILARGEVLAAITSGPEAGKFGPFQAGATDGRQTLANIVGLNDTFLPWQLLEHDEPVGFTYECTAVQAWCTERDATGARIPLTNATADAMRGLKGLQVQFR